MSETEAEELAVLLLLRGYELRLLRCTLPLSPSPSPAPSPPSVHLHSLISDLLASVEAGRYLDALASPAASRLVFGLDHSAPPPPIEDSAECADRLYSSLISNLLASAEAGRYLDALASPAASRLVFGLDHSAPPPPIEDSAECADRLYSEFLGRAESFLGGEDDGEKGLRVVVVMCIAVAAFLGFVQCNMIGPLEGLPKCPLPLGGDEFREWDNWARNQLMSSGSDLLGKFSNLQYIVFAKMLLMRTKDLVSQGFRSISWWLARVLLTQQRISDERSSSLFDLLQVLTHETLHHFGTLDKLTSYWGASLHNNEGLEILSMIHLEAGIMEYTYGRVDSCRLHFELAEAAAGLKLYVTGVLGFRTFYQVEPKAQMVLVANRSSSKIDKNRQSDSSGPHKQDSNNNDESSNPHQSGTHDASDILMTPRLLENDSVSRISEEAFQVGGTAVPLRAIHQAVILAKCLLIEKSTRHDDMQRWDMAPYIEAIDSQRTSCFTIQCCCDILRIRWESTRSRTKERALMMMDKLVQGLYEPSPGVAQRIPLSHGVYIPTIASLRKEYGELLVRCGLIGEAVKTFEDLELWDNLILCYRLLEKKAAAVELIKARLSLTPNDPRLWCSLGDVTNNDDCYEKALEVSNNRSARAKRSLARSAYNRGEYETSKVLWESAMALNSLYLDGWFALGAAALKARDVEKALDGFTRAVQLDPENGEAWNNIACLHMIRKKSKEAFIAFKEALKFKRNSWQLWENYGQVAFDVGNISQALESVRMVLEMTKNKRIDAELLEKIMTEAEERSSANPSSSARIDDQVSPDEFSIYTGNESSECQEGRSRETEQFVDFLGKVLQQAVKSGTGADIWGLYARWHMLKGDLTMCSEALLKQVRSYQGSDLWNDRNQFRKFAHASIELCKVYMEISSSTGSRRELFTVEMHLKNTIKQAVTFSDTEEFRDLQACLELVQSKLQSNSVSA